MSLFRASGPPRLPPAPIFAPEAGNGTADPMASLFSEASTRAAPQLSAPPGATGARNSLFDGPIKDPLPPSRPPVDLWALDAPAPAPRAVEVSVPAPQSGAQARSLPTAAQGKPTTAGPPPPPPGVLRTSKKSVESRGAAVPKRAVAPDATPGVADAVLPAAPGAASVSDTQPSKRAPKRRIPRGPGKLTLSLLGAASVVALGGAAALLGLIPSPLARAPAPTVARGMVQPHTARPAAQPRVPAAPTETPAPTRPRVAAALPVDTAKSAEPATAPRTLTPEPPQVTAQAAATGQDESGGVLQALISAARRKLADDDPKGAEVLMRQLLAKDPQDHHAMELLVRALMDQDRGPDALPYARKIVQRRPRRIAYRLLLGDLLLMVGNEGAAHKEWAEARKLAPDDPQIKRRLGL